jgi:hypothetical protein
MSKEPELKDKSHEPRLKNSAGDNPYLFDCPWCGALKGCLCKTEDNKEYTDGSYHRARLMKDCLDQATKDAQCQLKLV